MRGINENPMMDEEKDHGGSEWLPFTNPTFNPFGIAPVLSASTRRWSKWVARIILIAIPAILPVVILIEERENVARRYLESGNQLIDRGYPLSALDELNKAIEASPFNAEAHYTRGHILAELDNLKGAIQAYTKALDIDPRFSYAYIGRAHAKYASKDYQGSINDYTNASELGTEYAADIYYYRGDARSALDDFKGACRDFKLAASFGNQAVLQWLETDDSFWCRKIH